MKNPTAPTLEEWRQLYTAAETYKRAEPWKKLPDEGLVAVEDPESGMIGYCCAVGDLGELLGLIVYRGDEGLESYDRIQGGQGIEDAMFLQDCLMATFDSRDDLMEEDLEVIRALGLQFRGEQSWPVFRDSIPHYFPWLINSSQASFLTACLEQVAGVAARLVTESVSIHKADDEDLVFLRQFRDGQWQDGWIQPMMAQRENLQLSEEGAAEVQRIFRSLKHSGGIWEIDCSFNPEPLRDEEDERPYFARMLVCIEPKSEFILGTEFLKPGGPEAIITGFVEVCSKSEFYPDAVRLASEETLFALKPIADAIGIKLVLVPSLPKIKKIKRKLEKIQERMGR